MITLCMDTSTKYLVIGLIKDDELIDSMQKECWKNQSELLFPELLALLDKHHFVAEDIDQIVITEGPGSYTGVRIAMTVAKVFCGLKDVPLATLGTLQLFAGNTPKCRVVLDARSKRVYTAVYENGILQGDLEVMDAAEVENMLQEDDVVIGDGSLVGREDVIPDLASNFLTLKDQWQFAKNVHTVKPEYLKPSESYLVKK